MMKNMDETLLNISKSNQEKINIQQIKLNVLLKNLPHKIAFNLVF